MSSDPSPERFKDGIQVNGLRSLVIHQWLNSGRILLKMATVIPFLLDQIVLEKRVPSVSA